MCHSTDANGGNYNDMKIRTSEGLPQKRLCADASEEDFSTIACELLRDEARPFAELAIPTMLMKWAYVFTPFVVASIVGRTFDAVHLSAFTLANLTSGLCSLSLLLGIYSASDTLAPQALGAGNYREVGVVAMRGFFVSLVVLAAVNALLIPNMIPVMAALGQHPDVALHAKEWYQISAVSLPFFSLYSATWRFLSVQNIIMPTVYACSIACLGVLPIALNIFIPLYGFLGTAYAFVVFQFAQMLLLLLFIWWWQPHKAETWPGLRCWREALDYHRVVEYVSLASGGILAQSEWVYWEAVGLLVGTTGVIPLSVHTIASQLILVGYMVPFGIGIVLNIRMGIWMSVDVRRTKILALLAMAASTVCITIMVALSYVFRHSFFALFTTNQEVIDSADAIWFYVCVYLFLDSIFATFTGIVSALELQWTLGIINIVLLWGVGIPILYYETILQGHGIGAIWVCINIPYVGINALLIAAFFLKDWDALSLKICRRDDKMDSTVATQVSQLDSEANDIEANETTHLLMV